MSKDKIQKNGLSEREKAIVNYMSSRIGKSIEVIDTNASDTLKLSAGLLTVLIAISTYFKIDSLYIIAPILFLFLGIVSFIIVVIPRKTEYVVGDVESCIKSYEKLRDTKIFWTRFGYIFTFFGMGYFIFVIVA